MKFCEGVLADFDARTGGNGGGLQLNDVGHIGKNFWRELRRDGIEQSLARMIWMDGIGDDGLAGMEGVGTFPGKRLGWIAVREKLGLGGADFEFGEVFDGAGPGELRIVEGGVVANGSGKQRER